ncbi:MAG: DUF4249 domain-containing protein [Chryseolinea sp.]
MRKLAITFLFWIVLDSCIEPFPIVLTKSQTQLVIDGMISDEPGPYEVKLYTTKALDDQLGAPNWVKKADVRITDDLGNEEILLESSAGIYKTKATGIKGQVGATYVLSVTTTDGVSYESEPQKILPVGEFQDLRYEFQQDKDPEETDHLNTTNGFNIYIDAQVLPEQGGLVRWRTTGTFEIKTVPETRMILKGTSGGGIVLVPDPPPCSGWKYTPKDGLQQKGECTCCECWITDYSKQPILSDAKFILNGSISDFKIGFIAASRRFFNEKYYLEVEQMSLSQDAYSFWSVLAKQSQSGSDLFQTPPASVKGNIHGLNGIADPIGIFTAASIKRKNITIERSEVPYYLPPIDSIKDSCLSIYKVSSTTKPPFW